MIEGEEIADKMEKAGCKPILASVIPIGFASALV
jgi:hypothetical protein